MKNVTPPPKIIAHRGGAGLRPENTMAAFDHAISLGVDGVEVDVHLSADGQVVVHHDYALNPDLARWQGDWLTETGPLIKDLTFDQLLDYDVGRLKPGSLLDVLHPQNMPLDGQRIPLLADVLQRLSRPDADGMIILIELKTSADNPEQSATPFALAKAVGHIVSEMRFASRSFVISFDWRALAHSQSFLPDVPTAYLTVPADPSFDLATWTNGAVTHEDQSVVEAIAKSGGDLWGPIFLDMTEEDVQAAHQAGLGISVWTPNKEEEIQQLLGWGVDFITTDRPDLALSLVRQTLVDHS